MFLVLYRFAHESQSSVTHPWKSIEFMQDHAPTFYEFIDELRKKRFRRNKEQDLFELYTPEGNRLEQSSTFVTKREYVIVHRLPSHPRIIVRGVGSVVHWMM